MEEIPQSKGGCVLLYDGEVKALINSGKKSSSSKHNCLIEEVPQSKGGGVLLYDGEVRILVHSC
jgi:hypothetical protein